ncbi:MAG: DUF2846 domain-containing protein [Gammaproteobacteria bacterium]|nr:DUF2846 domain-containing protein [Gammaproteobacteria bacterium]
MKKYLLVSAIIATLVGCASVPMGDPAQDTALKNFEAPQNKAGLYIYRNESIGGAVKMDVEIDGEVIGETVAKTYFYKEVTPGKHTVTSKAENTDSLEIDVNVGTLTYIWQEVKMGILYARTRLHLVDEATGRKGVLESKLAMSK